MVEKKITVGIIGDANAGKTSLAQAYLDGNFEDPEPTSGFHEHLQHKGQTSQFNKKFDLDVLDFGGQADNSGVMRIGITKCDVILLCYDK